MPSDGSRNMSYAKNNASYTGNMDMKDQRLFAMCPPQFQRIGSECYWLAKIRTSWLDAHFICKDRKSRLAELQKISDRKLRQFLQKRELNHKKKDPIWFGASLDWQNNVWQWSTGGINLTYDSFAYRNIRWSSHSCLEHHRFICQHKMARVKERDRTKWYKRWNNTFPGQMANEVILKAVDLKGKKGKRNFGNKTTFNKDTLQVQYNKQEQIPYIRKNMPTGSSNDGFGYITSIHYLNNARNLYTDNEFERAQRYDRKLQREREKEQIRIQRKQKENMLMGKQNGSESSKSNRSDHPQRTTHKKNTPSKEEMLEFQTKFLSQFHSVEKLLDQQKSTTPSYKDRITNLDVLQAKKSIGVSKSESVPSNSQEYVSTETNDNQVLENKKHHYAERLARLSKEQKEEFLRRRKSRKILKDRLQKH